MFGRLLSLAFAVYWLEHIIQCLPFYQTAKPSMVNACRWSSNDQTTASDLWSVPVDSAKKKRRTPVILQYQQKAEAWFPTPVTIAFYDMLVRQHFPTASTCDVRLWLKRGVEPLCSSWWKKPFWALTGLQMLTCLCTGYFNSRQSSVIVLSKVDCNCLLVTALANPSCVVCT